MGCSFVWQGVVFCPKFRAIAPHHLHTANTTTTIAVIIIFITNTILYRAGARGAVSRHGQQGC